MKDFHCRDAGMNCDWIAKGNSEAEIMGQARTHAEQVHHLRITGDMESKLSSLIHDESSEAHRRSMQAKA